VGTWPKAKTNESRALKRAIKRRQNEACAQWALGEAKAEWSRGLKRAERAKAKYREE